MPETTTTPYIPPHLREDALQLKAWWLAQILTRASWWAETNPTALATFIQQIADQHEACYQTGNWEKRWV